MSTLKSDNMKERRYRAWNKFGLGFTEEIEIFINNCRIYSRTSPSNKDSGITKDYVVEYGANRWNCTTFDTKRKAINFAKKQK